MEDKRSYKKSKSLNWIKKPMYISSSIFFGLILFSLIFMYWIIKNKNDLIFICIWLMFSLLLVSALILKVSSKIKYISLFFNYKFIFNEKISTKKFTLVLILIFFIVNYLAILIIYKICKHYSISYELSRYFYLIDFLFSFLSILVLCLYFMLYKNEIIKNKYIDDGIITFSGSNHNENNSHMILKSSKAILIDCGNNAKTIIKYVTANNIKITNVLITHFHYDHWIGLNDILEFDNNVVFLMNQITYDWMYSGNEINKKYLKDVKSKINTDKIPNLKFEIIEKNGTLKINDIEIKNSLIRGHTPDSSFYLIESLNAIFVGDTIFYNDVGFHHFEYTNIEEFKASILYIQNYSKNIYVYPGHHRNFTSKKSKQWSLIDKIKI